MTKLLIQLLRQIDPLDPDLRDFVQRRVEEGKTPASFEDLRSERSKGSADSMDPEERAMDTDVTQLLSDKHGELRYIGEAGFLSFLEEVRRYVANMESTRGVNQSEYTPASFESLSQESESRQIDSDPLGVQVEHTTDNFVSGSFQNEIDDNLDQTSTDAFAAEDLMWMGRDEMKKLCGFAEKGSPLTRLLFSARECEGWIDLLGGRHSNERRNHDGGRRKRLGKTIVLYLVFALGLLYAPPSEAGKANDAQAIASLETALRLMRVEMLAEDGTILAVQAFALATVACLTVCKRHAAWIHLGNTSWSPLDGVMSLIVVSGTSIRCAQALGLHRRCINARFTPNEIMARTRLWWGLYLLDRIMSTAHGRPLAIDDHDCDEFSSDDIPATAYPWEGEWLAFMVRLTCLHGRIQRELYRRRNLLSSRDVLESTIKDAQQMAQELQNIHNQLPDKFRLDRLVTVKKQELRGALLQLHLEYFCAYQHITRMFLLLSIRRLPTGPITDTQNDTPEANELPSRFTSSTTELAKTSVMCAAETIKLVWSLYVSDALPRRCLTLVYVWLA